MGIELPAELADVAARTGARWPAADEDAMREQAASWRDAAKQLSTLAADADTAASGALEAMAGQAGDAARAHWSGFVDPDSGKLTSAARGAGQAADRLDHAARQIGDAKVEIVRQLVDAARDVDAANAAARGGHPDALLGLDTLIGGVASNVASVNDSLATAVSDTGRELGGAEVVDPHPGGRGQGGRDLLDTVTGEAGEAGEPVADAADRATDAARQGVDDVRDEVSATAVTPPSGVPIGGHSGSFAEAPTPSAGVGVGYGEPAGAARSGPSPQVSGAIHSQTSVAGYADAAGVTAAGAPGVVPPVGGPPQAGGAAVGAAPFGGQQAAAVRQAVPAPAPVAAPGAAAGGAAPGGQAGQAAPDARGGNRTVGPLAGERPEARQAPVAPPPHQPPPQQPAAALGTLRTSRQSVVALFLVHMFPIGHLPVASSKPARQLPAPPAETDLAAGFRFEPHDHPESGCFDTAPPGTAAGGDRPAVTGSDGLPADHLTVTALLDGYDPIADMHERAWDRRYVVTYDRATPEFAWPPGEVYPEGGYSDGEPVMLAVGTEIDRFGDKYGRVFAADGTSYRRRSLPPPRLDAGYHRYRVLRELPMWRAVSASWFGQPGGGDRYRAVYPVGDLLAMGYLAEITGEAVADAGEEKPDNNEAGGEA